MADSNSWSRLLELPLTGLDKKRYARISTDGTGVYVNIVREDKNGNTHTQTFFPEHMHYFTDELPDMIKHAAAHDLRIMKQKAREELESN